MFSRRLWFGPFLSFSPLQGSSGFLALQTFPSPLYFSPICLLSARFCLFSRPPPVSIPHIVRPPLSVRRKAINPPASVDQCLLLVSFPSVPYAGLHPPRPVRLVVLGLGVGGGAKETAPPAMVLSPSTRRQASPGQVACLFQRRRSSFLLILSIVAV